MAVTEIGDSVRIPAWRGWLVVFGGTLIHFTLGVVYSYGNLIPYLASYMDAYVAPGTRTKDLVWLLGCSSLGMGSTMVLGGMLAHKLTPKIVSLIGFGTLMTAFVTSSFAVQYSVLLLIIFGGVIQGISTGLSYMPPMSLAMQWFPGRKGLISGCITSGFGFGAFLFTNVETLYLNPNNTKINATTGYFDDPQLLNRVPSLFLVLAAIMAVLQVVGWLLLKPAPNQVDKKLSLTIDTALCTPYGSKILSTAPNGTQFGSKTLSPEPECKDPSPSVAVALLSNGTPKHKHVDYLTPRESLKTREFYILWIAMFCNSNFIGFIASVYKAFGQTFIEDDQFLALVGSIAAILNSAGRICWGFAVDRFQYKHIMWFLTSAITVLLCTWTLTPHLPKEAYAIFVWVLYFTEAAHMSLMPAVVAATFGTEHVSTIYGLVATACIVNGPFISALIQVLYPHIGWTGLCYVVSGFAVTTFFTTFLYRGSHIGQRRI